MNIIIAEDEYAAKKNLLAILKEVSPACNVIASFESVEEIRSWIKHNPPPDLAFFDIQLSDRNIFHLFKVADIRFPIVFVTAYDHYALKAFKVNSIDYILKPVGSEAIKFAIDKYNTIIQLGQDTRQEKILGMMEKISKIEDKKIKKTYLANYKDRLIPIQLMDIAYFYIDHGIVYIMTLNGKSYSISQNLDEISNKIDDNIFFRANRQFIISRTAINDITPYFNERLIINVRPEPQQKIIVSKSKATNFKNWLGFS